MNETISFAPTQDLGRYLQSLDSVRYAESDPDASIIHARAEAILSLLFGQTIPIGEHQFLDSAGFFDCATGLIESLEKLELKDRQRVETIFPFRLGIRKMYSNIDNLIAEKLGDKGFKLSLWKGIGQNNPDAHSIRQSIKAKYLSGNFRFEEDDLISQEDEGVAKKLRLIRRIFKEGEEGKILSLYNTPTIFFARQIGLLEAGLKQIIQLTETDLREQIKTEQRIEDRGLYVNETFDDDMIPAAMELIESLKILQVAGVAFNNRSDIRLNPVVKEKISKKDEYDAIVEIFDILYNTSIATAVEAHSEVVSGSQTINGNNYKNAALALSALAKNKAASQPTKNENILDITNRGLLHWSQDTNFSLLQETKADVFVAQTPWEKIWQAYLDPKWRESVSALNNTLIEWDQLMMAPTLNIDHYQNISLKMDDVISHHAKVVSDIVSDTCWKIFKDSEDGKMVVEILPSTVGLAARYGALYVMEKFGADQDEAMADSIGLAVGAATHKLIKPSVKSVAKGYMRRIFERIYNPKP